MLSDCRCIAHAEDHDLSQFILGEKGGENIDAVVDTFIPGHAICVFILLDWQGGKCLPVR